MNAEIRKLVRYAYLAGVLAGEERQDKKQAHLKVKTFGEMWRKSRTKRRMDNLFPQTATQPKQTIEAEQENAERVKEGR